MKENRCIEGVIFDWAGTAIDYGCSAPVAVFVNVFKKYAIDITIEETRKPMGLNKYDHIRELLFSKRISELWKNRYQYYPEEKEVQKLYEEFMPFMIETVAGYSDPVPGCAEVITALRQAKIKIGSTTGYTRAMLDRVLPAARAKGFVTDYSVASDEVPAGRPYPWMCYLNAMALGVYPMSKLVKVGDTVVDMQEGRNAGMWSIGVVHGGNELGLTIEEERQADPDELERRISAVEDTLYAAGAHLVIDRIGDIPAAITLINEKLGKGLLPETVLVLR